MKKTTKDCNTLCRSLNKELDDFSKWDKRKKESILNDLIFVCAIEIYSFVVVFFYLIHIFLQ